MPYGIGIDLGGTNLKVVAASHAGEVLERQLGYLAAKASIND